MAAGPTARAQTGWLHGSWRREDGVHPRSSRSTLPGGYLADRTERQVMQATEHDELWKPGQWHYIPRIDEDGDYCQITRLTMNIIDFQGPTGPASITRELYRRLIKEQS